MSDFVELQIVFRPSDQTLCGAYLKLSTRKVHRTVEVVRDSLLADYDKDGRLVGIDLLGPVNVSAVVELVEPDQQATIEGLIRDRIGDLLIAA